MGRYIMALDQGTTSSRCILFDRSGEIVSSAQKEIAQIYPQAGWVEQDPDAIWASQVGVAQEAMARIRATYEDIDSIGITNQRETTIVWDKKTGAPVYNAIVWQCRRTAGICDDLKDAGWAEIVRKKCGLIIDSYFSGTKIKWILDNVPGARERAEAGELLFGTVDSWLIWNLTNGKVHATDYSNASRTMMFNIITKEWDEELLCMLGVPASMLPQVQPSSGDFGYTDPKSFFGSLPILGVAGDQQSALFGQTCTSAGQAKNTYGTGCFLLMNTGDKPVFSKSGLLTTIAWRLGETEANYALEGSVFTAGSAIQWLRDDMRIIDSALDSEFYANKVPDTCGVYVVPAFVGLGAPYWDPYARGTIIGITRAANKNHIIRATLESQAYQIFDVLEAMQSDAGVELKSLKVDGGASSNNFLMQFQADILQVPIIRPKCIESTAIGAAFLAGMASGFWVNQEEINFCVSIERVFEPSISKDRRDELIAGWRRAVERSRGWVQPS